MEWSRSRRLVQMALHGDPTTAGTSTGERRYSIVKLLEEGHFVIVPSENVRMTETNDLHMTTYNNREYLCIIFNTGGLREIQDMLEILHRFKSLESRFKYLSSSTSNTQTQISDIYLSRMEEEDQTDQSFPAETSLTEQGEKRRVQETRRLQFCIFCNQTNTKLWRHLTTRHAEEERVKEIMSIPPQDSRRRLLLSKLRMEGYVKYNKEEKVVARKGSGKTKYLQCIACNAFYSELTYHRHYSKCTGQKAPKNVKDLAKNMEILNQASPPIKISEPLQTVVLAGMRDPEILDEIIMDKDIIDFGNSQCLRFGKGLLKQKNLVRYKLRTIAKVKVGMCRLDSSVQNIVDVFHPEKWDNFLLVIQELAHLEMNTISKQAPNTVNHIGLIMHNLARDIKASILPCSEEDRMKKEYIQIWIDVYERKFSSTIGWQATNLAKEKKWKSKKLIPLADDLRKFHNHLNDKIQSSKTTLQVKFEQNAWVDLNKSCMIHLMSFNRKRVGEMMTLTLEDYNKKSEIQTGTDVYEGLSETEKALSANYYHLVIRGKGTRPVPLLIHKDIASAIDLLIKHRDIAGVAKQNNHLFAKKGLANFNANVAFTEAAYACGAQNPQYITGTSLRKHIATMSQAINLSDNDLKILCGFLGHTEQTHLEHYRMPSDAVHTARLSRLLTAFNSGNINDFKGKTLEEIETADIILQEEEEVDDEEVKIAEEEIATTTSQPRKKVKSRKSEKTIPKKSSLRKKISTSTNDSKQQWQPSKNVETSRKKSHSQSSSFIHHLHPKKTPLDHA